MIRVGGRRGEKREGGEKINADGNGEETWGGNK